MIPAPPRSGVPGLTPSEVRVALLGNRWGVLPIAEHDDTKKGAGKRPLLKAWATYAEFEADLPTLVDVHSWERQFQSYGDPTASGTGVPCGTVVGIDIDVRDAAKAGEIAGIAREVFGDTPFVRQGAAPKLLLVYRAAEPIAGGLYPPLDGFGGGVDVLADKKQFVAFGIHPGTGRRYEWIGRESPLTAEPQAAPEITGEQVAAFLNLVNGVVALSMSGGAGRGRKAGGGESAEIVRDAEGYVVDGREAYLTREIWGAANRLNQNGAVLTVEGIAAFAWERFSATARLDVEGRAWTHADAMVKARGTLDRITRRIISLPPRLDGVAATYPVDALPVAEAEAEVARHVGEFFTLCVPTHRNALALFRAGAGGLLAPESQAWVLKIETGIGKTERAIASVAGAACGGLNIGYAVPTVRLGEEVAVRFTKLGVDARVYRGRDQPDPERPGDAICLNPIAVRDAREAGARNVMEAVCEVRARSGRPATVCPRHAECGYMRQRAARPVVWIVPQALLFRGKPGALGSLDALVIDESFINGALPANPATLTLDLIEHAALPDDPASADTLDRARVLLVGALRSSLDGPVTRQALNDHGITAAVARAAREAESLRWVDPGITPATDPCDRARRAAEAGAVNREVKAMAGLWAEVERFLELNHVASGRLTLSRADENGARTIERRSLRPVHDTWRCPTLILDATAPTAELLSLALGMPVEMKASVSARWPAFGEVRQIVEAPVSATKLGLTAKPGNVEVYNDLIRIISLRARLAWPLTVAVVAQKSAIERLRAMGLPENVTTASFGALAGLDSMRAVRGLIVIGRPSPSLFAMEGNAAVFTGEPIPSAPVEPGKTRWFDKVPGGIRLADGRAWGIPCDRHADPIAEALRWQVCEAQLIQAVGRLRPLRRNALSPFFLDIIGDVVVPVTVDRVERWDDARLGPWSDMAARGVMLDKAGDAAIAYPDLAATRKAARVLTAAVTVAPTSIEESYIDLRATVSAVTYKRAGRFPVTDAFTLPGGPREPAAVREWLEANVGPMESVEVPARALDRLKLAGVVRSMDGDAPGDVWERVEARLGRTATAMERNAVKSAVMREGDARFVERKRWDDIEGADMLLPADCGVEGEDGEPIGPGGWRRHRAA
ncbi:bifunctional DNA primase/polymerase [Lichenibacterium dinghuense]|uniref:bifunctional DNA primase/polymerase n=1 Tax=Lichenibacterium dinghuense TaxID=2895977 RepID=UPI001F171043|nr:bifunctional DNA primase/polymerase [Lichenibacterium sp. 6Y81]